MVSGYLEVPVDETLAADIRAIPGVQATVGVRVRDWEHAGGTVALDAFDPSYFTAPVFGQWPLVGERLPNAWEQVARGEGVVVSSNFVTNVGGKVGDKITLTTPNGPLPVQITGVTVDFASPRGTIEMSRDLYRRFWNDQQLTRVFVRAVPGAALPSLRESIAKTVGRRYGLRVLSSRELMDYFAMQVRRAFAPVNILAAMTLLVVVMGMSDTLVAGVVERTRDLGVMRAVGVRRRYLRRLVVGEGIVLGALGLLLALLAGLTLGTLWVETTFPYLLGWALSLSVPYTWAAVVVAVTLAVCAVASLLPAWRAAALKPAVALRYE